LESQIHEDNNNLLSVANVKVQDNKKAMILSFSQTDIIHVKSVVRKILFPSIYSWTGRTLPGFSTIGFGSLLGLLKAFTMNLFFGSFTCGS
jgi:hypothetical protein